MVIHTVNFVLLVVSTGASPAGDALAAQKDKCESISLYCSGVRDGGLPSEFEEGLSSLGTTPLQLYCDVELGESLWHRVVANKICCQLHSSVLTL